ncbi:unnamed protein product [Staurois parvus]|uniref:Uncharacterized protein n=1 Tax=Staurois parvus TaxID=386267 RepID=A0ABN9FSF5_9NEOB|nr:unnamed protein product [Staurois parvus]
MGPRTNSSCCCQARNLSWAPVPPPHAAARSRVCVMGPCTASHCCCLHRHTLPCATFRSPHTAGGFHFVIGCCRLRPPIAAASTATMWLHTLVLAP